MVLSLVGALKADRLGLTDLLTWGGLRGGLAVAMAMSLPAGPEKGVILHMTYGTMQPPRHGCAPPAWQHPTARGARSRIAVTRK